jgi:hypothetical protein
VHRPLLIQNSFHQDLDDSYADMYFDNNWQSKESHKYIFEKTSGIQKIFEDDDIDYTFQETRNTSHVHLPPETPKPVDPTQEDIQ